MDQAKSESPETAGVTEINLGDFTRTQGLMKSLRLLINNQIVVQAEDIAGGLSDAGRKFKMGDIEQANLDVTRLFAAFGQRTMQWESQARNLEQQMKTQAAKNPKSISIDAMNRMKAEQTAVRTRIRTAEVNFRRLHQGLDLAYTNLQSRPKSARWKVATPQAMPANFFAQFQSMAIADRAQFVRASFGIEAVLAVNVSKGTQGGYDIKFDPLPPLNRVYFLTKIAQLVRLEQLGKMVVLQNLETGQNQEMKLVEFVKQVQGGVWLLKTGNDRVSPITDSAAQ